MHRINVGGPTYHAAFLCSGLNDYDFETKLISGNIDSSEKSGEYILNQYSVNVTYVKNMFRKISLFKDFVSFFEIRKIIKQYKPDIVHTHAAKSGFIGRLAAKSLDVPIIVHTFHGHIFHSYFGKFKTYFFILLERFLALISDSIIAISNSQKNDLIKYKIVNKKKISVINLGFDLEKFNSNKKKKRAKFRKKYNLKENEIAIGIIGRLDPIKNHRLFIDSIKFVKSNTNKIIKAFIIGDGRQKLELMDYCKKIGLIYNNRDEDCDINFTSWINEIDVANAGLDIIALTSLNEGTPVSLIEAQASSKPVVCTNVGGVADVVRKNKTALVCDHPENEDFKRLLLACVNDIKLRNRLSKRGFSYVSKKFSKQRLISDISKLYLNIYEKKINKSK